MEAALGRAIVRPEVVIHVNGNKHDNRLENLRVVTAGYWTNKRITLVCQSCGNEYKRPPGEVVRSRFCSRKCAWKFIGRNRGTSFRARTGGRKRSHQGYIAIYRPLHPNAHKDGYVWEHRLVAEEKYCRPLLRSESVHHINGIKDDNRPENLEVLSHAEHSAITATENGAKMRKIKAEHEAYLLKYGPLEES
jgi:hypothetical protein